MVVRSIDADHEGEASIAAGRHAGSGVLDDHTAFRSHSQPGGGLPKDSRVGLAAQVECFGHDPVDANGK